MPATDRPTRAVVLDWIAENDAGGGAAADEFGIPAGTIYRWIHDAKKSAGRRPKAKAGGKNKKKPGTPGEPPKGLTKKKARPPARMKRGSTPAADLPVSDRGMLRAAVRHCLTRLAEPIDEDHLVEDTKARAQLSRTLDTLLARCPDILTFEERSADADGGAGSEAARGADADRLRTAMGVDPEPG